MDSAMLLVRIRAELERLQLHAVNFRVEHLDHQFATVQGSLLAYWKLPGRLPGRWLLEQLQALPDKAGPVAVMEVLVATCPPMARGETQLKLFDTALTAAASSTAEARRDS